MKLIFMGTPRFALPTLGALTRYDIVSVVTQTDKPSGRGRKVTFPPVKEFALSNDIPVLQPETVRSEDFLGRVSELNPDFIIVVAFGQILPEKLLSIPLYGVINLHASLLPKYRGASPINRAIINGDKTTGVTTMFVEKKMDAGDILLQKEIEILPEDDYISLAGKMSQAGAPLMLETIEGVIKNRILPRPQDERLVTYAPMLKKEDGRIRWNEPLEKLNNLIRGVQPWPGAFTFCEGRLWKIFSMRNTGITTEHIPGTIVDISKNAIYTATHDFIAAIEEIQPENKNRMPVSEFLKGNNIKPGIQLV